MSGAQLALVRTEGRLFLREPLAVFWVVAFPTILLVVLGLVPSFREPSPDLGGHTVIALYVHVCILLSMVIVGAQSMPAVLVGYRQRQILRRLRTTPVRPHGLVVAQGLVHAGAVAVAAVVCLVVGRVAYAAPLPEAPAAYLLVMLLALAAMMATGAVIAALAPSDQVGNVLGMAVMFPTMFTTGVWVPVQAMSDTLQRVVEWSPMGAASQALAEANAGQLPDPFHLAVVAGWTLALGVFAVRYFRWE